MASAAKLTMDWILELVFPGFALTTVRYLTATIQAQELGDDWV